MASTHYVKWDQMSPELPLPKCSERPTGYSISSSMVSLYVMSWYFSIQVLELLSSTSNWLDSSYWSVGFWWNLNTSWSNESSFNKNTSILGSSMLVRTFCKTAGISDPGKLTLTTNFAYHVIAIGLIIVHFKAGPTFNGLSNLVSLTGLPRSTVSIAGILDILICRLQFRPWPVCRRLRYWKIIFRMALKVAKTRLSFSNVFDNFSKCSFG